MRKYLLIVSLLLIFTGCNITEDETMNEKTDSATDEREAPEEKLFIKTEGKKEVSISELEQDALFTFTGRQNDIEFDLFFYAENETIEPLEFGSYLGEVGDPIASGDYSFYIAPPDSEVAYKQSQIEPISFETNTNVDFYDTTYLEDRTLFSIFQREASVIHTPYVYTLHDGELQEVDMELGPVFSPRLKAIDDDKIQAVQYFNSGETGWNFVTLELNDEELKVDRLHEKFYDVESGEVLYKNWVTYEDALVPYTDTFEQWEMPETIIEDGKEGKLANIPVTLGEEMYTFFEENKQIHFEYWLMGRWFDVERYVDYGNFEIGYIPDVSPDDKVMDPEKRYRGKITTLKISSAQSNITMADVKEKLGKPDEEGAFYEGPEPDHGVRYQLTDKIFLEFMERYGSDNVSVILKLNN
ncbi:MAG TPA: hypothetical protein VK085_13105 [Pseudogracilibacillus sp.]|nr:hypothetical protein [Pseudogracilibacillus sp.]